MPSIAPHLCDADGTSTTHAFLTSIDVDDVSDAWAAASWARTAIAIKRVRATLQFEDEGQDAHSRMAKELTALAEVGFARMVRPHLPQPVVEDLYPR